MPVAGPGQRQDRRGVVEPDVAEDDDDRRDHQRQQGDELDERPPARQLQPHPVGGRHHDQHAHDDGQQRQHDRIAEGRAERRIGRARRGRRRSCRRRAASAARTRTCRSAAGRSRSPPARATNAEFMRQARQASQTARMSTVRPIHVRQRRISAAPAAHPDVDGVGDAGDHDHPEGQRIAEMRVLQHVAADLREEQDRHDRERRARSARRPSPPRRRRWRRAARTCRAASATGSAAPPCASTAARVAPRISAASRHSRFSPSSAGVTIRIISGIWKNR